MPTAAVVRGFLVPWRRAIGCVAISSRRVLVWGATVGWHDEGKIGMLYTWRLRRVGGKGECRIASKVGIWLFMPSFGVKCRAMRVTGTLTERNDSRSPLRYLRDEGLTRTGERVAGRPTRPPNHQHPRGQLIERKLTMPKRPLNGYLDTPSCCAADGFP